MLSGLIQDDKINYFVYFYNTLFVSYFLGLLYLNLGHQSFIDLKKIPENKLIEAKSRVISSFQAIIMTSVSILYIFEKITYETWFCSIPISAGFGITDIIIMTSNYEKFKRGYNFLFLHHVMLIFCPLTIRTDISHIVVYLYLFEITVPMLDYTWYLYNIKRQNTLIFKIFSAGSVISYVVFRICNNIYLFTFLEPFTSCRQFIGLNFLSLFLTLNCYWFYSLIAMFVKKLS
jgi:hypothetical protein